MDLKEKINAEMKSAIKNKDQVALRAIRAIKSAILLAETAEGRVAGPLTESEELSLLMRQAKQRRDSSAQFTANGREDLAKIEEEELEVIERFLPQQLNEEELRDELRKIITEVGASSPKEMGKVMGLAKQKLAGKADGGKIAQIVKKLLLNG